MTAQTERPPAEPEGALSNWAGPLRTPTTIPDGCDTPRRQRRRKPEPDAIELGDWLELLYGRCEPGTWLAGSMVPSEGRHAGQLRARSFRTVTDARRLANELAATAEHHDVYVGCCPLIHPPAKGRARAADVGALPALWADLDVAGPGHAPGADALPLPGTFADALAAVGELPPPSVVIDSGGGLQTWWILDVPLSIDDDNRADVAELCKGWGRALVAAGAAKGWHVDDVSDLTRVLRPPGSVNRGSDRPPAAVAIVPGEGCASRYSLDQLTPHLVGT